MRKLSLKNIFKKIKKLEIKPVFIKNSDEWNVNKGYLYYVLK